MATEEQTITVCHRVAFSFAGTTVGSAFDSATRALLPVRKRSGRDELVLWGRRDGEPGTSEEVAVVAMETIKGGAWEAFEPRWVKLFVDRYQVINAQGRALWHELPHGSCLQGVLIRDTDELRTQRVYIASVRAPKQFAALSHDGRWPHIAAPGANGADTPEATRPGDPAADTVIATESPLPGTDTAHTDRPGQ